MAKWSPKDPQDVRDYWYDCAGFIAPNASLTDAEVTITPDQHETVDPYTDLELLSSAVANPPESDSDTWVVIRVQHGTPAAYDIHYRVTDSTGQVIDFDKTLVVKERKIP